MRPNVTCARSRLAFAAATALSASGIAVRTSSRAASARREADVQIARIERNQQLAFAHAIAGLHLHFAHVAHQFRGDHGRSAGAHRPGRFIDRGPCLGGRRRRRRRRRRAAGDAAAFSFGASLHPASQMRDRNRNQQIASSFSSEPPNPPSASLPPVRASPRRCADRGSPPDAGSALRAPPSPCEAGR